MFRITVVFCALFVSSFAVAQSQFEFKGVPLGASEQEFKGVHANADCGTPRNAEGKMLADRSCTMMRLNCTSHNLSKEACAAMLSYGGAPVELISASFYDDKLSSVYILIKPDQFDRITTALSEAFGAGAVKDEPFQTRGGLSVVNPKREWRRGDSSIRASKYGGSLDSGSVSIQLDSYAADFKARKEQRSRSDAKNL